MQSVDSHPHDDESPNFFRQEKLLAKKIPPLDFVVRKRRAETALFANASGTRDVTVATASYEEE